MEAIIQDILEKLPLIFQAIGSLVIVATAIVRLTPDVQDDEQVGAIAEKFFKFLSYLPTIGINPRTKKIEDAYKELSKPKAKDD